MAYDPFSNKFLALPSFPLQSIWNDDDTWLTTPSTPSGVSLSEDDKSVYVEASLPGIDPDNIDITYENGYLWIKGDAEEKEEDKKRKYYRHATRSFSYRIAVPGDVDLNAEPVATHKNGVMQITFAKSPKAQPKKIQIKKAL